MTTPTPTISTASKPAKLEFIHVGRTFTGFYHFRATNILCKNFVLEGDLNDAIVRFQGHCTRMGYKYIKVIPFIVDLDHQELMAQEGRSLESGRY